MLSPKVLSRTARAANMSTVHDSRGEPGAEPVTGGPPDQTERDHAALKAAVRAGKIDVQLEE